MISYFMACLPQLGSVPAAYAVVAGGCDWPLPPEDVLKFGACSGELQSFTPVYSWYGDV